MIKFIFIHDKKCWRHDKLESERIQAVSDSRDAYALVENGGRNEKFAAEIQQLPIDPVHDSLIDLLGSEGERLI
jgi:hypothetical protein